jgi:hypothetical protein
VIEWVGVKHLCVYLVAEFCPCGLVDLVDLVLSVELEWSY